MGSLFDGIGTFMLAGQMNGIKPVWSSEIEKFPMAVSKARFPDVEQLSDVTKIKGGDIEAVDIITFGSPCRARIYQSQENNSEYTKGNVQTCSLKQ